MMDFLMAVQHKIAQGILVLSTLFAFNASSTPTQTPKPATSSPAISRATSTIPVIPEKPRIASSTAISATSTKPTTTQPQKPKVTPKITVKPQPVVKPVVNSLPINPPVSPFSTTSLAEREKLTRDSVVNIFCLSRNPSIFPPITGSGVVIDPKGVILTNAHIGQYFLLKDIPEKDTVSCSIRTGSPAVARYTAKPLYVSTNWIKENAALLHSAVQKGTGENDFALLLIDSTNASSTFPYLPPELKIDPAVSDNVLIGAYAAGLLGGIEIAQNLYGTFTYTTIEKLFTFKAESIDLLYLKGNPAAQKGSSGGAVVNTSNNVIGLISTVSDGATTNEKTLGAITTSHINSRLIAEQGISLTDFLKADTRADLEKKSLQFQLLIAPVLREMIIQALSH